MIWGEGWIAFLLDRVILEIKKVGQHCCCCHFFDRYLTRRYPGD